MRTNPASASQQTATVATSSKLRDHDKICLVFPLLAERTVGAWSKLSIFEGTHGLSGASAKNVSGRMYNAGNGGRITLNQAWRLVQELEGISIAPEYGPPRAGDVRDSQADVTAAVRDLGHAPRFSFEEGMRRTLEWYRQQR